MEKLGEIITSLNRSDLSSEIKNKIINLVEDYSNIKFDCKKDKVEAYSYADGYDEGFRKGKICGKEKAKDEGSEITEKW